MVFTYSARAASCRARMAWGSPAARNRPSVSAKSLSTRSWTSLSRAVTPVTPEASAARFSSVVPETAAFGARPERSAAICCRSATGSLPTRTAGTDTRGFGGCDSILWAAWRRYPFSSAESARRGSSIRRNKALAGSRCAPRLSAETTPPAIIHAKRTRTTIEVRALTLLFLNMTVPSQFVVGEISPVMVEGGLGVVSHVVPLCVLTGQELEDLHQDFLFARPQQGRDLFRIRPEMEDQLLVGRPKILDAQRQRQQGGQVI